MNASASPGRVLVTGVSGFIGRSLIETLIDAGWQVRAALRNAAALPSRPGLVPLLLGDLSRPVEWRPLLEDVDFVVHLAGIAHATTAIPEATYQAVNAEAVASLGEAARHSSVRRVVLMSSVRAQCGPSADHVLSEREAAQPVDAYGRSKLAGEQALGTALAIGDCDYCVLRPVLVYGPGVKGNMALLRKLAASGLPLPLGALTARRSLLGLSNLAGAVQHALMSPAVSRDTFLLADPGPLTVPQIIAAMREGLGHPQRLLSIPLASVRIAAGLAGRGDAWSRIAGDLVVSTSALEATGWHPVETAAQGLKRWMVQASRS